MAKAILVFVTALAYTPIATPSEAFSTGAAAPAGAGAAHMGSTDDAEEDGDDPDGDPSPCRPGKAPSAVTGRCVPDFPEHECPDGGMSIWNRCPRSAPCAGGGASVNGECPGPAERFCDEGVSFADSCAEDAAALRRGDAAFRAPRPRNL